MGSLGKTILFLIFVILTPFTALGEKLAPDSVTAEDKKNDAGGSVVVRWKKVAGEVRSYEVIRVDEDGTEHRVGVVPQGKVKFIDGSEKAPLKNGVLYRYRIKAVYSDGTIGESALSARVASRPSWFHTGRVANLLAVLLFALIFFALIVRGRRGASIYIRPIAGLTALEDAVGRAAEMGRPILYVPGLQDVSEPATLASMSILADVSGRAARLRTKVKVPNYSPLTWPVAQNVMREAYQKVGRAEDFDPDDVTYLTSRSFTFAASVIGMMTREKTASNFLIGRFFSESLILAETGAATDALQIGGTDSETQLPFFITTCDYTLIGEEVFAAAAEVSNDLVSKSTIAAHDWFKLAAMVLMVAGLALGLLDAFGLDCASDLAHKLAAALTEER